MLLEQSQNAKYPRFQFFLLLPFHHSFFGSRFNAPSISMWTKKNLLRLVLTLQVIWQCSWVISVLYYFLHSWHKFSWCEISYKIERRNYQEVLLPDLKSRKQASKRFCRFHRFESLYLHERVRYFNRHPNLDSQTSGEQKSSKKFRKFPGVAFYEGR